MEKTRKHIEDNLRHYDDLYWEYSGKLVEERKELDKIQTKVNNLQCDVDKYNSERKYFQELYDELNDN